MTAAQAVPSSLFRGMLWPTVAVVVGTTVLATLGTWQLERLAWKEGLLAAIAARTTAAPAPLPSPASWGGLDPGTYEYRHVVATGTFDHAAEVRVFRPLGDARGPFSGLGDLVLTPLKLEGGGTVVVNRGFVPEDRVDPATRPEGQVTGRVTVTGLMRSPESRTAFTPADQPAKRLWFTRDPGSIAAALGLGDVAPFTIDQDAGETPGGLPQGGETVLAFPNNHLSYALTWFGLAATLLGLYASALFRRRREAIAADRKGATP